MSEPGLHTNNEAAIKTSDTSSKKKHKKALNLKKLRISLKYHPKIYRLILKLRHTIREKNKLLFKYRHELQQKVNLVDTKSSEIKTENELSPNESNKAANSVKEPQAEASLWDVSKDKQEKSIAEQVAEVAQSALAESGMVYVESAGMYYDYKTGYYYSSELGLYYHTDTGCYYTFSDENKTFKFHSYPDTSKLQQNEALLKHERKKAKKRKQDKEKEETCKPKKSKSKKIINQESKKDPIVEKGANNNGVSEKIVEEIEDGECSDTASEAEQSEECDSASTASDDGHGKQVLLTLSCPPAFLRAFSSTDAVSKYHPPCMRVIIKESSLPKLKIGSLFLITKDGGTIGREGDHHTIVLKDVNVSRNHLEIRYDVARRMYTANDLGSKNGSILNGTRMSASQVVSGPKEVPHGSILQLGETRLLCHVHAGADTCGHCEPGLLMEADEKDKKVAYTRNCSVQKQHQMELARLKNLYAPQPLAIEDGSYKDRAKERRETVGSTHESEKTQQSDLETSIAADNKGFQLLKKMGWSKGEGLGKDGQGDTEPIPLVSNETKAGLGSAGSAAPVTVGAIGSVPLRMTKTKPLRPPARLFRDPLEEDDD